MRPFPVCTRLIVLFLTPLPRELGALAVAGLLLLSKRLSSRDMIGGVDWHLLLLFACLFGVTAAFAKTGLAQEALAGLAASGILPERLSVMLPVTLASSNTIGNVPAVILILKLLPSLPQGVLTGNLKSGSFAAADGALVKGEIVVDRGRGRIEVGGSQP